MAPQFFRTLLEYENYIVLAVIPLFWLLLTAVVPQSTTYWLQYWWLFPIALLIATVVNMVGISGAALFVPFFVIIFPLVAMSLEPAQSVQIGLITESFGLTSSALAFLRYKLIDTKLGFYTILGALPFVIGGSIASLYLQDYIFFFLLAGTLLTSVYLLLHERKQSKEKCLVHDEIGEHHENHEQNVTLTDKDGKTYKYCRCNYKKRFLGYGVGGLFQGIAGFGIGELGISTMLLTKIPIRVAIGTSHMVVAITAIAASVTHVLQSTAHKAPTPWNIVFMTVPAVIVGGQIAPYISAKVKTDVLEYSVAGLFIILSIALLYLGIIHVL